MTERELQNQILEFLTKHPKVGFITKYNNLQASKMARRSKYQPSGIPDLIGCMKNGIALYIEVKLPKGRVSSSQQTFLKARVKDHCVAFIARSIDDCIDAFKDFGY